MRIRVPRLAWIQASDIDAAIGETQGVEDGLLGVLETVILEEPTDEDVEVIDEPFVEADQFEFANEDAEIDDGLLGVLEDETEEAPEESTEFEELEDVPVAMLANAEAGTNQIEIGDGTSPTDEEIDITAFADEDESINDNFVVEGSVDGGTNQIEIEDDSAPQASAHLLVSDDQEADETVLSVLEDGPEGTHYVGEQEHVSESLLAHMDTEPPAEAFTIEDLAAAEAATAVLEAGPEETAQVAESESLHDSILATLEVEDSRFVRDVEQGIETCTYSLVSTFSLLYRKVFNALVGAAADAGRRGMFHYVAFAEQSGVESTMQDAHDWNAEPVSINADEISSRFDTPIKHRRSWMVEESDWEWILHLEFSRKVTVEHFKRWVSQNPIHLPRDKENGHPEVLLVLREVEYGHAPIQSPATGTRVAFTFEARQSPL